MLELEFAIWTEATVQKSSLTISQTAVQIKQFISSTDPATTTFSTPTHNGLCRDTFDNHGRFFNFIDELALMSHCWR